MHIYIYIYIYIHIHTYIHTYIHTSTALLEHLRDLLVDVGRPARQRQLGYVPRPQRFIPNATNMSLSTTTAAV